MPIFMEVIKLLLISNGSKKHFIFLQSFHEIIKQGSKAENKK